MWYLSRPAHLIGPFESWEQARSYAHLNRLRDHDIVPESSPRVTNLTIRAEQTALKPYGG